MANIYRDFMSPASEKQAATATDIEIRRGIEQCEKNELEDSIQYQGNWELFFHLAQVRKNVLTWYKFKNDAEVLEVDAGNGALTGLLCEKCAHVTATVFSAYRAETILKRYEDKDNLDIYVGSVGNMKFQKKFDYIILIGSLEGIPKEKRENYLKRLSGMLKADGTILTAVDNRYGLRYLCGAREYHSGKAYDGLNGYDDKAKGYSFDRQELLDLFEKTGFVHRRMFYPMPDYIVTQAVYSDEVLPACDTYSKMKTAYWGYDTMKADENIIYNDAVRNKIFPFVAPSFLLECSRVELCRQEIATELPYQVNESTHKNFEAKANALQKINKEKGIVDSNRNLEIDEEFLRLNKKELDQLEKIKKVQLDIYQEFSRICDKHKLTFFVFRGTLLGAIRHNGYIPWDDDIDVAMPRKDFEKFRQIVLDELKEPYFFQSSQTDDNFFWGNMCRIRNCNTTGISEEEIGKKGKLGIWIDILVLDNIFVEKHKQEKQLKQISFWCSLLLRKTYGRDKSILSFVEENKFLDSLALVLPRKYLIKGFEKACKKCPDEKTNLYSTFNRKVSPNTLVTYDKRDFAKKIDWKFENVKVPVPDEYDHLLKQSMGKFYRKYPKVEKRMPKHSGILNVDIPYWHFQKLWIDELKHTLILLGDNTLMEEFLGRYGTERNVLYIDAVTEEIYQKHGEADFIICTDEYEKYVREMDNFKIENYYIFVTKEIGVI